MVCVSKKSLDDYYYQLRLGELYNFNFICNLDEKIGHLRSYIQRERKVVKKRRGRNEKHPTKLKILSHYDLEKHKLNNIKA